MKGKFTILVVRIRTATWLHPNKKWLSVLWCNGITDARFVLAQFINGFNGMGMSVWLPDMDRMRERASGSGRVRDCAWVRVGATLRASISGTHLQILHDFVKLLFLLFLFFLLPATLIFQCLYILKLNKLYKQKNPATLVSGWWHSRRVVRTCKKPLEKKKKRKKKKKKKDLQVNNRRG